MLFDTDAKPHLRAWLARTLEPICDADPGALADYVAALLERDIPEADLRKELSSQLDEFLEKDGPPFIDTLFTVLRTKSYIPYASALAPSTSQISAAAGGDDAGIPIPLDAIMSPPIPTGPSALRKRALEDGGDGNAPAKGPRLGNFPNGRHDRRDYNPMENGMGHVNPSRNVAGRPKIHIPPEQLNGICRDYHVKGYCARGAFCKYSHSDDAMFPAQMMPMGGGGGGGGVGGMQQPYMPMFANPLAFNGGPAAGGGGAYDPHEARLDMRSQKLGGMQPGMGKFHYTPRAPIIPRGADDGANGRGELPVIQDLTPQAPPEDEAPPGEHEIPVHQPRGPRRIPEYAPPVGALGGRVMSGGPGAGPPMMGGPPMGIPMEVDGRPQMGMPTPFNGGFPRGGMMGGGPRGGAHLGGGRGTFPGAAAPGFEHEGGGSAPTSGPGARPERRQDKTLVVEKIPAEKLSIEAVTGWFKKFGTVTNVAIDARGAKALVSFEGHDAARDAWRSEDAVFGNRFVKVFWHRPMGGHGERGSKMLAQSAQLVRNLGTSGPAANGDGPAPAAPPKSAAASALAAKQQRLEQQIAEQKALMAKLDGASAEEKKELFAQLRKLGEEIKKSTAGAPVPSVSARPAPHAPAPVAPTPPRATATPTEDEEKRKMELLDKELDLHAATADDGGDTTEALKAQLAKLKAEAASLGIADPAAAPAYTPGGYRPYRGRARGRAFFRGAGGPARGGPPRASMKLDNRPKKLLVKGAAAETLQGVRDWYEAVGMLDAVDTLENGDVLVAFKTRSAAEQGLAKGNNIPMVGQVQVAWHAGPTPAAKPNGGPLAPDGAFDHTMSEVDQPREEELAATGGWGAADDGMGMM